MRLGAGQAGLKASIGEPLLLSEWEMGWKREIGKIQEGSSDRTDRGRQTAPAIYFFELLTMSTITATYTGTVLNVSLPLNPSW